MREHCKLIGMDGPLAGTFKKHILPISYLPIETISAPIPIPTVTPISMKS